MIHQYKLGGYNIVLDICSGAVHVVDELAYDCIALFEQNSREEIIVTFLVILELLPRKLSRVCEFAPVFTHLLADTLRDRIVDIKVRSRLAEQWRKLARVEDACAALLVFQCYMLVFIDP